MKNIKHAYTMVVRLSEAIYRIKTLPQGILLHATAEICSLCLCVCTHTHMNECVFVVSLPLFRVANSRICVWLCECECIYSFRQSMLTHAIG